MAAKQYTDSELRRMQQDAVERVREMQSRANLSPEPAQGRFVPPPGYVNPNFRNWNTNPGMPRRRNRQQVQEPFPPPPPEPVEEVRTPEETPPAEQESPPPVQEEALPPLPPDGEEKTTLIQDILGGIGLDDDRLLIIGMLFILINAKADTTLILALMYLLI